MPKNVLDFPELPQKTSNLRRLLLSINTRRIKIFTILLAFLNTLLAVITEEEYKIDAFANAVTFEIITFPLIAMLSIFLWAIIKYFSSEKIADALVVGILVWGYNAQNIVFLIGILYGFRIGLL